MEIEKDPLIRTALCTQYEVLQNRIGLHGTRLWQLPFTYVGFSAIATPVAFTNSSVLPLSLFFFGLCIIGLLVMGCMMSAWRGYKRTGKNMNEVERRLGIGEYTQFGPWHVRPYFILMGTVAIGILTLAIMFIGQ